MEDSAIEKLNSSIRSAQEIATLAQKIYRSTGRSIYQLLLRASIAILEDFNKLATSLFEANGLNAGEVELNLRDGMLALSKLY